ncbi:MAG: hypothetical protein M1818_001596 [Claussenomyces sp. TS43310]|nr:MAG: hypothetical protein M1818_001596 [Claussenomyces sp. TS43310]
MAKPQSLQVAQILADLNDLHLADPPTALALVTANKTLTTNNNNSSDRRPHRSSKPSLFSSPSSGSSRSQQQQRQASTPSLSRRTSFKPARTRTSSSDAAATPVATLPRAESSRSSLRLDERAVGEVDEGDADMQRARTLLELYDARGRLPQQEMASLLKARANVEAIQARYATLAAEGGSAPRD